MTEYIIIVALIAIVAIGVSTLFGGTIRDSMLSLFGVSAEGLAGEGDVKDRGAKSEQDRLEQQKPRDVRERNSGH